MGKVSIIVLIILMFVSFGISAMFAASSEAINDEGNIDSETGLEILRELDKVPFIKIDVDEIEANLEKTKDGLEVTCSPEQRDVEACIEIYQPVCATVNVQCVKAPCNPVKQTFSNSCKACTNSLVEDYVEGAC